MISADPGPSLAIGATILIETKRFPVFIDPAHSSVSNWGLFEGTALAVMFPKEGKANLLGSAILVAPGIAIGAMHVFTGVEEEVLAAKAGAYCFGVDGERIDMWSIRHVSSSSDWHSDLAIYSFGVRKQNAGRLEIHACGLEHPDAGHRRDTDDGWLSRTRFIHGATAPGADGR